MLVPNQTDLFASPGSHLSSLFLITTKIPDFCSAKELALLSEPKGVVQKMINPKNGNLKCKYYGKFISRSIMNMADTAQE